MGKYIFQNANAANIIFSRKKGPRASFDESGLFSTLILHHNFEGQITVGAFPHSQLFAGIFNAVRLL